MHVQFVDLTITIHVKRCIFKPETTLRSVMDFFADKWTVEKVTVNGRQIIESELECPIEKFGNPDIQIEQHK